MVINVLSDGTVVDKIDRQLTREENPEFYAILERIAEKENSNERTDICGF